MPRRAVDIMRQLSVAPLPAIAAACGGSAPRCSLHDAQERVLHFERWRIFLRFFCRRRVLFFFHFQRNIERAFLYGFDLCAMAAAGPGVRPRYLQRRRAKMATAM